VSLKAVMSTHYYVMHAITRNPECGNWVMYIQNHCSSSDKRVQVAASWIFDLSSDDVSFIRLHAHPTYLLVTPQGS